MRDIPPRDDSAIAAVDKHALVELNRKLASRDRALQRGIIPVRRQARRGMDGDECKPNLMIDEMLSPPSFFCALSQISASESLMYIVLLGITFMTSVYTM
jgi:hypothetical protein